uniref:dCMP deaminase n=1 Tax=Talaromyces marneffei PM1 TaxID=1077442 RepID=A0A093VU35_TALMA
MVEGEYPRNVFPGTTKKFLGSTVTHSLDKLAANMLIGICGGICAGKHAIAEYLIREQGFELLQLANKNPLHISNEPKDPVRLEDSEREVLPSRKDEPIFDTVDSLLEFVTKQWTGRWVTTDIWDHTALDRLLQRPFFLLIGGLGTTTGNDWLCPSHKSYRCTRQKLNPPDLEEFVMWNDRHLYDREIGRAYLTDRAQVRLFNASSSLEELYAALKNLDLSNDERLRPTWDQYFMQLASLAAQRSNCMKRRVGCVIVRDRRVISTGYNGTPRNITNCNEGGSQVGISEVVYSKSYNMDKESAAILKAAGVQLRQFSPPPNGLTYLQHPGQSKTLPIL